MARKCGYGAAPAPEPVVPGGASSGARDRQGDGKTPRTRLHRALVLGAAIRIADHAGPDSLTLTALAQALGVRVPSLYNHVAGLQGLQRDLALQGTRELGAVLAEAAIGRSGGDAVIMLARAYRRFVLAHPGLYALMLRTDYARIDLDAELAAESVRVVNVVVAVLAAYGLHGDDALHAVRGLRAILHGFATLEAAGNFAMPLDVEESFSRVVALHVDGLRRLARRGR